MRMRLTVVELVTWAIKWTRTRPNTARPATNLVKLALVVNIGEPVGRKRAPVPEIRTTRLVLRGWRASDRHEFAAMNADPEVMEHFAEPLSKAASDRLVDAIEEGWDRHGYGLWAVERLADGALLGFTGLSRPSFDAPFMPAVEIGWRLRRAAWGQGYATEAAEAAAAFAFETVGLAELVSFTVPANERSRRFMERLGMTHDPKDDFDHPKLLHHDVLRRHVLYRLSREAWARRRSS